jgi:EAL domain
MGSVKASEGVLDGQTLGRLDRWRKARAVFVRPDGVEAERAVAAAFGRSWVRAPMYGRARRLLVERTPAHFLDELTKALGPLAERVRVAPEDMQQTKWDAMSRLTPLARARIEVEALWLADELSTGDFFVEFQPIFDLKSGEGLGQEGLLRARGRAATRLAAEIFPAAEALHLAPSFESFSWSCVLEAATRLSEGTLLFLNVNPRLIGRAEDALAALGAEAEKRGVSFSRLVLDIVEIETLPAATELATARASSRSG